jgi:hypothetical protein
LRGGRHTTEESREHRPRFGQREAKLDSGLASLVDGLDRGSKPRNLDPDYKGKDVGNQLDATLDQASTLGRLLGLEASGTTRMSSVQIADQSPRGTSKLSALSDPRAGRGRAG